MPNVRQRNAGADPTMALVSLEKHEWARDAFDRQAELNPSLTHLFILLKQEQMTSVYVVTEHGRLCLDPLPAFKTLKHLQALLTFAGRRDTPLGKVSWWQRRNLRRWYDALPQELRQLRFRAGALTVDELVLAWRAFGILLRTRDDDTIGLLRELLALQAEGGAFRVEELVGFCLLIERFRREQDDETALRRDVGKLTLSTGEHVYSDVIIMESVVVPSKSTTDS
jgi:hypothetical protein